jgi:hypothetical protein
MPADDVLAAIHEEKDERLVFLADLLAAENEIERCGLHYFVMNARDFQPHLSESLPEAFVEAFMSFSASKEHDWLDNVYAAWFELLIATGRRTGSGLLQQWAEWEYSLRTWLRLDRLKNAGRGSSDSETLLPAFMKDFSEQPDNAHLVEAYRSFSEPLKAEKFLDQARIDYLRKSAMQFSFSLDELIAYLLELRIHNRYLRLNPDKGRKILEEVTTL